MGDSAYSTDAGATTLSRLTTAQIAAGGNHNVYLKTDGILGAWGNNYYGQLGDGTSGSATNKTAPVRVGTDTTWVGITAGGSHSVAIKSNGTLWGWGYNNYGQVGTGSATTQYNSPTQIGTDTAWLWVDGGGYHTAAIKTDGTLWAWGYNYSGQVGDGTSGSTANKTSPVQIGTATTWAAVSAGGSHTMALRTDGTLWGWGSGSVGQTGVGNAASPMQVGTDKTWVAVAAGGYHTVAIKADGTLWAWGYNTSGQVGTGSTTTTYYTSPTQIGTDKTWVAVAAGGSHTVALKANGTLWAWGKNDNGQVGTGSSTTTQYNSPTQIGTGTAWIAVSAGENHTVALKSDGTVWTWGANTSGQAGDATTTNRTAPVQAIIYPEAPASPAGLTASAFSSNRINLSWTDSATEGWYTIERKTGSTGTYSQLATVPANVTIYADLGLFPETEYYYRVKATNLMGDSAYSTDAGATTPALNAPTGLTAAAQSTSQIKLAWTDNSSDETNFYIERKTGTTGTYAVIATVSANTTTYYDSGLSQDALKNYYYRVAAYNEPNYLYSNEASAPIVTFSNVAVSTNTLNTAANETSTIFFVIDMPATVTLKIIPESQGPTGTPVYQASQACAAAGAYRFIWDGKDSAGSLLPDEAYLYIMEGTDAAAGWYSPAAPSGSGSISCSQGTTSNAFHNEPLAVSYTVDQPSRINLSITYADWSTATVSVMSAVPHAAGSHALAWDGWNSSGKIAPAGGAVSCSVSSLMRENIIITSGNAPGISDVKTDPYAVNISFGEFARLKYNLSREAKVTVTLTSPSGTSTTLVSAQTQTAGDHEVEWTALDATDSTGKKTVISEEGYYAVTIQAVNPTTGKSSTARASLKVGL
jgi:alpha-tubulin suppressor-like RCC1 family protein/flagellar hook assembly protein FlgD